MLTRPLRTFTAIYLVAASTIACNPSDPGVTTEATTDPTTGVTTTGVTTTSDSSTGEPTTEPPTTGTSTSGDSESATGTTTSDSSSTGPLTGDESSSSSGDASGSSGTTAETGDPLTPVSFAECQGGDASMCPAVDPACLVVDGPGGFNPDGSFFVTWSYCTRECDEDADCSTDLQGGTAKALCVPKGPNDVKVCVLDCSFGKTCPGELECSNDDTCGTRFCDCEGNGCEDFLCTGD